MPSYPAALFDHLRRLASPPPADADLLQRWVSQRDEDAFAALVARHGRMVLGVCRRVLGNAHDAEDVFQAVFLILARKAATLRHPEALAGFLHGVAMRSACKARAAASRRPSAETGSSALEPCDPHPDPLDLLSARELLSLIDQEIVRLPEVYRLPVVLCDLEERTQEEAARLLGWTHGSLRGRLLRGRARLRSRLARRGVAPAMLASVLAAGLTRATDAAIPSVLAASVTRSAVLFSTCAASVEIPPVVAALAREGVRGMVVAKLKLVSVVLLAVSAFAAGAGMLARHTLAPQAAEERAEKNPPAAPSAQPNGKARVRRDRDGEPLPTEAISRLGTTRLRHGGIQNLGFTADGKTLISYGWDSVRFWDSATGKELRRLPEQKFAGGLTPSPDGKWLAFYDNSGKQDEGIAILDSASGQLVRRFSLPGRVQSLLFSPEGKVLAAARMNHAIELLDAATGRPLQTLSGHKARIWSLAFSADSKALVSASDDKTIRFWDVGTGKQLRQIVRDNGISKIALSSDGKFLASIDTIKHVTEGGGAYWDYDNHVHLWDAATGKELRQLAMPEKEIFPGFRVSFRQLDFAPDSKTLLTGGMDGTLRIWDPATGRELRQFSGFTGSPGPFAFAPDRKSLAVVDGYWTIRLLDLASGKDRLALSGHRGDVFSVVVPPDCQSVVTMSRDGTLRFWELATGKELRQRTVPVENYRYTQLRPDGRTYLAAGADGLFRVYDVRDGKERALLRGHKTFFPFALSPDQKTLASANAEKTVRLLDPATGEVRHTLTKVKHYVSGMSFTADSRTLVIWDADRIVTVWDIATGKKRRQFTAPTEDGGPVRDNAQFIPYKAALSPDGKLLAFGLQIYAPQKGFVPLMDTRIGKEVRRLELPESYVDLVFSPDGKTLASSNWRDDSLHLSEIATGRERRRFKGHEGDGCSPLAFAPDGKTLISSARDITLLVWDLTGWLAAGEKGGKPLSNDALKTHWEALAADDAAAGYRAIQALAADPERSVPYLGARLRAVAAVDNKRLTQWIADLDSEQFAVREKASDELEKSGEAALHALRRALDSKQSLETRRRLEQLIEKQVCQEWTPSAERLRIHRALEVLERADTAEAQRVLAALAAGAPGAWLTLDAQTALARLSKLPAASP